MMSRNEERAILLEGATSIEIELARNLLSEAGIPCVVEGPDFDVAELGRAAHDMLRGQSVFVPRSALERAKAIIAQAWGSDED